MKPVISENENQALPRYFAQVQRFGLDLGVGQLDIVLSDGRRFSHKGRKPGHVAEIHVLNPDLFARTLREGVLGFCDAYLDGWWTTPDLQALLDLTQLRENQGVLKAMPGTGFVRLYEKLRFWWQSNSRAQAKKNISYHYDLGNNFYGLWLDKSMTYSSAQYHTGDESLELAQEQKYAGIVARMGVKPGDHVLEIGCGWGGFAEYAASKHGLRVTGLTISQTQYDYAKARIEAAGLSDLVEFRMQDYRDERGQYDGIASIEMFEAVGERYWPVYFQTLHKCLKPGGHATLQIITVPDADWKLYIGRVDFIQKHIFPGGMLPAPFRLKEEAAQAGLSFVNSYEFGESYSQTLRLWHQEFNKHWPEVAALGFDDRFRRMWNFYLTSCAGSFQGGVCDVTQTTFQRPS